MGLFSFIFGIVVVGIIGDTVAKVARAKTVGGGRQLDELRRQLEDQSQILASQEQQILELQERTDFMERLLAKNREQGLIDDRLPGQPPPK